MSSAQTIDELRNRLLDLLERAEIWLGSCASASITTSHRRLEIEENVNELRRKRTRAASALMNIAFIGAFSSGKTFLLSGLQDRLEFFEVEDPEGNPAHMYVGLLASAPVPT